MQIGAENELFIQLEGPGSLGLQYTLYDPAETRVLASGLAESGGSGGFTIKLDSAVGNALQPGLYQLFLGAFSDAVSTMTQRRVDLEASIDVPAPAAAEPTAAPQVQPTSAPALQQQEDDDEGGGGCGRGTSIELIYPLAALALLGLVVRRRLFS